MHFRFVIVVSLSFVSSVAAFGAGSSPVADAAMSGDVSLVRSLVARKADVNAPQADGATAIQWAAYKNDVAMADVLIKAGANVKTANREGATALYLASIAGSAPMLDRLLKAGADPNELGPEGETPLMLASRNGRVAAIEVLLAHKADVNAKDKLRGTTALMWAAEQGHADAVKTLIGHGADVAAESAIDTKGNKAYLAPTVSQRLAQGITLGRPRPARGARPGRGRPGAPLPANATVEERQVAADEAAAVSYTHLRAHETGRNIVC